MKRLSNYSIEYKRLKKYWKLIQMDYDDLDAISFKHFTHFKGLKTEFSVVRQSIEVDDLLLETYEIYQALLKSIKKKDSLRLKTLLESLKDEGSRHIQTAIKTMLDNFEYVSNALKLSFSNGITEGINNYIKVLKRVAFGYKSFFNFRNRILIARKLKTAFGY